MRAADHILLLVAVVVCAKQKSMFHFLNCYHPVLLVVDSVAAAQTQPHSCADAHIDNRNRVLQMRTALDESG